MQLSLYSGILCTLLCGFGVAEQNSVTGEDVTNAINSPSSPYNGNTYKDDISKALRDYEIGVALLSKKEATKSQLRSGIDHLENALALGNTDALPELVRIYFFGRYNLEPDYDACAPHLEICSNPECYYILGLFYEFALGGKPRSMQHALAYYGLAALRENTAGNITLGNAFATGTAVIKSCDKTRNYLFPVATKMALQIEREHRREFPKMDKISPPEPKDQVAGKAGTQSTQDVVEFYNFNANQRDPNSMVFLGRVYYLGIGGIAIDLQKARDYFNRAVELGSREAEGMLGHMDFYGEGVDRPNYKSSYERFQKAAAGKDPTGLNGLGLHYLKGIGVEMNLQLALEYFKRSSELENSEASYNYAKTLQLIDPVANEDRIFAAYLTALRGGFVLAGYELAKLNLYKDVTCGLATFLLRSMIEKHPSLSLHEEAVSLYRAGKHGAALSRFLYFAAQGYEVARFNAAYLLEQMGRKSKNPNTYYQRAVILWSQVAVQGDSTALVKTGDYFYYGLGIRKVPVTAAAYYHKALEKKSGQAAFNLAYLYHHGIGVALDFSLARRYYELAIVLGKAESQAEAWLPAYFALKHLTITENFGNFDAILNWLKEPRRWKRIISTILLILTSLSLIPRIIRLGQPRIIAANRVNENRNEDDGVIIQN